MLILALMAALGCGPLPPPPVRGTPARPAPPPAKPAVDPLPVATPDPPAAENTTAVAPAENDLDIPGVFHPVEPGQTLWRISRTYGVSPELLATVNELDDPTVIESGQQLFIPGVERLRKVDVYRPPDDPPVARTTGLQLRWPVSGTITSRFGGRRNHTGLDIAAPSNTPVMAAADGEVTYSGNGLRGYGNLVVIDHGRGVVTLYAHNRRNLVHKGQRVRQGERIAKVGSTGHSTGPHVHFEVQVDGIRVDPQLHLD
jgi:murein DD-endopeptidase MepM/ murein hydrolase activator NlpD